MRNLPDFEAWAVFATVARVGSFAGAAEEINLSQATVSKIITRLENKTKNRLFHRSSRRLELTESGASILEEANQLLSQGENLEAKFSELTLSLSGLVRVSAPMFFGINFLATLLPDFLKKYPELELDIQFDDKQVDLIAERFDVAVRIANLTDSSLIARGVNQIRLLLVGSPKYFEKHGYPQHPNDLLEHKILYYIHTKQPNWRFYHETEGEVTQNLPRPILQTNNAEAFGPLLNDGVGLALQPEFFVTNDIKEGRLIPVMQDWQVAPISISLVSPPGRLRPARVQVLIDYLADNLGILQY